MRDVGDFGIEEDFDSHFVKILEGFLGEAWGEGSEEAVGTFDEEDAGGGGVDIAEFFGEGVGRDFFDRAGELHAGGSTSDDDEGEFRAAGVGIFFVFSFFEREKNAVSHGESIFEGFEARGELGEVVSPEVTVRRTGGEDEVIVANGVPVKVDTLLREIDLFDFAEKDSAIFYAA